MTPWTGNAGLTGGRVLRVVPVGDHCELTVRLPAGPDVRVAVNAQPNPAHARRAILGMRRLPHVELFLPDLESGRHASARLSARVGRQHELHRRIPLGTALALARDGAPTQVLVAPVRCHAAH